MAEQNDRPPLVVALEWVGKITTVAIEMVIPVVVGSWLDRRWGTSFLALVGIAIGVSLGIWHLLILTGTGNDKGPKRPNSGKVDREHDQ